MDTHRWRFYSPRLPFVRVACFAQEDLCLKTTLTELTHLNGDLEKQRDFRKCCIVFEYLFCQS